LDWPTFASPPPEFLRAIRASSYSSPNNDLMCLQVLAFTGIPDYGWIFQ
jgi:hypothetical protein